MIYRILPCKHVRLWNASPGNVKYLLDFTIHINTGTTRYGKIPLTNVCCITICLISHNCIMSHLCNAWYIVQSVILLLIILIAIRRIRIVLLYLFTYRWIISIYSVQLEKTVNRCTRFYIMNSKLKDHYLVRIAQHFSILFIIFNFFYFQLITALHVYSLRHL